MRSSRLALVAALALSCAAALHADNTRTLNRRLPEWLEAMFTAADQKTIPLETITLTVPEEADAKPNQARAEVVTLGPFWKMAALIEMRAGEANLRNVTQPLGPKRSEADFEVAIEPPTIREGDVDKLRGASEDLAALADHLVADNAVKLEQLLASRPVPITLFGKTVSRLPVRFTLSGPRAAVLSRLAQLPGALPFAYLRMVKATPSADLTVSASLNLLGKATATPAPSTSPAAEIQRAATDKLTAAGVPDVKVVISSAPAADSTILSLKGTARDIASAKAALLAAIAFPGLRAFDELGWKNDGGNLQLTGLLHFGL